MTTNSQNYSDERKQHIMATLGRITRLVFQREEVPAHLLQALLSQPVTGLGMLARTVQWRSAHDKHPEDLMRLMDRIPGDIPPKFHVSMAYHGAFWMGYYHFVTAMDASRQLGAQDFAEVGKALFGEHWQSAMADALQLSDTARIRSWLSGKRSIPASVWNEVIEMLKHKQIRLEVLDKLIQSGTKE